MLVSFVSRPAFANILFGFLFIVIILSTVIPITVRVNLYEDVYKSTWQPDLLAFLSPWWSYEKCWADIYRGTKLTRMAENATFSYYHWSNLTDMWQIP
jgi:hypothetical protein